MKQLYIVEYESARWAGAPDHCVVWADSEDDARDTAAGFAEDHMSEQYRDHEYEGDEDDPHASIMSAELLKGSEYEQYYIMPEQRAAFYPCVNPEDGPTVFANINKPSFNLKNAQKK